MTSKLTLRLLQFVSYFRIQLMTYYIGPKTHKIYEIIQENLQELELRQMDKPNSRNIFNYVGWCSKYSSEFIEQNKLCRGRNINYNKSKTLLLPLDSALNIVY